MFSIVAEDGARDSRAEVLEDGTAVERLGTEVLGKCTAFWWVSCDGAKARRKTTTVCFRMWIWRGTLPLHLNRSFRLFVVQVWPAKLPIAPLHCSKEFPILLSSWPQVLHSHYRYHLWNRSQTLFQKRKHHIYLWDGSLWICDWQILFFWKKKKWWLLNRYFSWLPTPRSNVLLQTRFPLLLLPLPASLCRPISSHPWTAVVATCVAHKMAGNKTSWQVWKATINARKHRHIKGFIGQKWSIMLNLEYSSIWILCFENPVQLPRIYG